MPKTRILAMDLRRSYFGYAAFEMPLKILGSGVAVAKSSEQARTRIKILVKEFRPSLIVLRKLGQQSNRDRSRYTATARIVRHIAKAASISIGRVSEAQLRNFFRFLGKRNKYDLAALMAERFRDIRWKLPRKRKSFQPEPWTISQFDAVSLGTAYLYAHDAHGLLNIPNLNEA